MEYKEEIKYKKYHIKENKKIFKPLKTLTLEEAIYILNPWHHAVITEYNINPMEYNNYINLKLNYQEITNIIKFYGILPPRNHWYWYWD